MPTNGGTAYSRIQGAKFQNVLQGYFGWVWVVTGW